MIPMAYHFGLHPWDIDRLTIGQFEVYRAGLDQMAKQADAQSSGRPVRKR